MLRQRRVSVVARRGKFVGGSIGVQRSRVLAYALRLAVIDGEGVSKRSSGRKSTSLDLFCREGWSWLVSYIPLALGRPATFGKVCQNTTSAAARAFKDQNLTLRGCGAAVETRKTRQHCC